MRCPHTPHRRTPSSSRPLWLRSASYSWTDDFRRWRSSKDSYFLDWRLANPCITCSTPTLSANFFTGSMRSWASSRAKVAPLTLSRSMKTPTGTGTGSSAWTSAAPPVSPRLPARCAAATPHALRRGKRRHAAANDRRRPATFIHSFIDSFIYLFISWCVHHRSSCLPPPPSPSQCTCGGIP